MNEEIELRHLRYFLAVAETLHFSKAAERLGMAQPPLSQQIQRLETLIGHRLFDRTTRGVKLTAAGHLLVERARTTLEKMQDDIQQVQRRGRGEEGIITIGFSGSIMFTGLPAAIEAFRRLYPKVEMRLREMVTAEQLPAVTNGILDLAFVRDGDPTVGIKQTTLRAERFIAVLPSGHKLANKHGLQLRELRDDPFILFNRRHGPLAFDRTIRFCEDEGFRPNIVQDAPQWPTLVRLVAAGLGVSLAPACIADISIPGAVYREIPGDARTQIDMAVKAGSDSTLVRNFTRIAHEHISSG